MENSFYDNIVASIAKIMRDKNLTGATMAEYMDTTPSQFSKMLTGKVKISFAKLSKLATNLSMSEIDIMTYPDKYVKIGKPDDEPIEAILQIKLKKDKKDQVLKLVFGENNIEILNKFARIIITIVR